MPPRLVLASASPRRLELLRLAGLDPLVRPAAIDESPRPGEAPGAYVARLAREKAAGAPAARDDLVLGADTTVVVGGQMLAKPADGQQARAMLRLLAGRSHQVLTAVALQSAGAAAGECLVRTAVTFTALSERAVEAYASSGEPLDKAGAYAIQGRAAAFVERIDGSYTNVVGLPLVEALALLRAAGYPLP